MGREAIGLAASAVGFVLLVASGARAECPSDNVSDVLEDPTVQDALDDAWQDSNEGSPDEHEEGGFILECLSLDENGQLVVEYQIIRLESGDREKLNAPIPKNLPPGCRIVATFHTHPGPEKGHPEDDGFHNEEPSANDVNWADSTNLPGIIVYGTGPERDEDTDTITYGPQSPIDYCEPPEPKKAETKGDPHLTTFDGFVYSFQAVGEYVLAKSSDIEIQARFEPVTRSTVASVTTAVAVRAGPSVVMVHLDGERRVDGTVVDVLPPTLHGVTIEDTGDVVRMSWRDGTTLSVSDRRFLLNVRVESLRFDWEGLFGDGDGDPTNDLVGVDGPLEGRVDFEALYTQLRPRWAVTADTTIFSYRPGESVATFVDDAFPSSVVGFADFEEAEVDAARELCVSRIVWLSPYLEDCMYDFLVTGSETVVLAAADAHSQQFPITFVGEIDGAIDLEGSVAVEGAGELFILDGQPGHLISVTLTAMADVEMCPRATADFRLTIFDMTGSEIDGAWPGNTGCGAYGPWPIPSDGRMAVLVVSGDGLVGGDRPPRTGPFGLTLGTPDGRSEEVVLDLDESTIIDGAINVPLDFVDYRVAGAPGDLVSVDVLELDGQFDCGQEVWDAHIAVLTPNGEEIATGWPGIEACKAYGAWTIPSSGSLTIRIHGGFGSVAPATGIYQLEVGRFRYSDVDVQLAGGPVVVNGVVDIPLDGTRYAINAVPGSEVSVEVVAMDGRAGCGVEQWDLNFVVLSDGEIAGEEWPGLRGCRTYGPWTVPASGRLELLASGGTYERFVPTGSYRLEFSSS